MIARRLRAREPLLRATRHAAQPLDVVHHVGCIERRNEDAEARRILVIGREEFETVTGLADEDQAQALFLQQLGMLLEDADFEILDAAVVELEVLRHQLLAQLGHAEDDAQRPVIRSQHRVRQFLSRVLQLDRCGAPGVALVARLHQDDGAARQVDIVQGFLDDRVLAALRADEAVKLSIDNRLAQGRIAPGIDAVGQRYGRLLPAVAGDFAWKENGHVAPRMLYPVSGKHGRPAMARRMG